MDSIKRDVYVLKDTLKIPIEVTKGTNAVRFEFAVRDYDIPVTAMAVAYAYNRKMTKPNSLLCDVSKNTITFTPESNFFTVGTNELQIRVISDNKKIISFKERVKCSDSMDFPDDEEEGQDTLVEQILTFVGKETGERKRADEEEQKARTEADETEKEERQEEIKTERERIDALVESNKSTNKEIESAKAEIKSAKIQTQKNGDEIALLQGSLERILESNKVLWSGGTTLNTDHVCTLSEPVSSQQKGIVLVFCDYEPKGNGTEVSTAGNQGYWACFIPKQAVIDFDGRFFTCSTQYWSSANAVACNVLKGFYLSNTKITGHSCSITNGDGVYGIGSVLRKVYGV